MLNILIVCNAGMSSGILARKMQDLANGKATVKAVGVSEYQENLEDVEILLIGPQIRFQLEQIKENSNIPTMIIDIFKYGIMDAKGILEDALELNNAHQS